MSDAVSLLALADGEGASRPDVYAGDALWQCPLTRIWVVESYELVRQVLSRPADFSSKTTLAMLDAGFPAREIEAIYRDAGCGWARTLQTNDPPDHRRFRALVERVFTSSRVDAMTPFMEHAARALLADCPVDVSFDAIARVAMPLPLRVIANDLGVPEGDLPDLKRWSDAAIQSIGLGATREEHLEAARCGVEFQRYFGARLEKPLDLQPGTLIERVATAAHQAEARMTRAEQLSLLHQLMIAGHETTTSTLGSILLCLATRAGLMAQVRTDAGASKRLIEDVLRLHAPVQGLFRITTGDVRLGEQILPARTVLSLRLGAANRDPDRFSGDEPLAGPPAGAHLAFGLGLHHCIGAPLARRELLAVVGAVLERFGALRLGVAPGALVYSRSVMTRGLIGLPLIGSRHDH